MEKMYYRPMPKFPTYDEWRKWQMEVGVKVRTGNPNAVIVEPVSSEYEEYLKVSYEDYINWIGDTWIYDNIALKRTADKLKKIDMTAIYNYEMTGGGTMNA